VRLAMDNHCPDVLIAELRHTRADLLRRDGRDRDPNPHCSVCRWWHECDAHWRWDDHLSLVAGISKLQRKQLQAWEAVTVEHLATFPLPIKQHPEHGSKDGYVRVREQARVQVAGRNQGRPVHELLEILEERGLSRLPQPSPGDMFFDLEGDPFVGSGGREYLFGVVTEDEGGNAIYDSRWGTRHRRKSKRSSGSWIWSCRAGCGIQRCTSITSRPMSRRL
jgi:predicted RecB family nuclease